MLHLWVATRISLEFATPQWHMAFTTTHKIKKELSICQSLLCLDLVSFPVLSQIKPQAPVDSCRGGRAGYHPWGSRPGTDYILSSWATYLRLVSGPSP